MQHLTLRTNSDLQTRIKKLFKHAKARKKAAAFCTYVAFEGEMIKHIANGFCRISNTKIDRKWGRYFREKQLPKLKAAGIIIKDDSYLAGEFPKGYKVETSYHSSFDFKKKTVAPMKAAPMRSIKGKVHASSHEGFSIDRVAAANKVHEIAGATGKSAVWMAANLTKVARFEAMIPYVSYQSSGRQSNYAQTLRKELREYITCEGEECVELDINAAAPCFAVLVIRELSPHEVDKWEMLVAKGMLYETIAADLGVSRKQAKDMLTPWLGGSMKNKALHNWIKSHFPDFYAIWKKRNDEDRGWLSKETQKLEASVMVEKFAKRGKGICIHDSLIVPVSQARQILKELRATLYFTLDFVPSISGFDEVETKAA